MTLAPPSSVDVAVIGAGAAGIAAARRLTGTGLSVVVLTALGLDAGRGPGDESS